MMAKRESRIAFWCCGWLFPVPGVIGSLTGVLGVVVSIDVEGLALPQDMFTVGLMGCVAPGQNSGFSKFPSDRIFAPGRSDSGTTSNTAENCVCPPIFAGRRALLFRY